MKIFYSWQSDLPNSSNRGFIRKALEDAVKEIASDLDIADADRPPEVDEATKNTKGMVDIREAILRKISECQLYVADLTPVTHTKKKKALPNPNVMYETGWASNKPGYDFIIGVMNTHSNKGPDALPFDLRGRRILTYKLGPTADDKTRGGVRKQLTEALAGAIRGNLAGVSERASTENPIVPCQADDKDPSLWGVGSNTRFSVPNGFGKLDDVAIKPGPRAYARVVAAAWPKGKPDAIDLEASELKVEASSLGYHAGSYGTCELGYVRYWFDSLPGNVQTSGSMALYLEECGEYWGISDGPIAEIPIGTIVSTPRVFYYWRNFLRQALALFDQFGASKRRLLEVGIVGIEKAFLADTRRDFNVPQSRKPRVTTRRQEAVWTEMQLQALLRDSYNALQSAFSQRKLSDDEFKSLLENN